LNQGKKDEAAVKQSVKDLKGFFLRSYEFDKNGPFKFRLEDLKPFWIRSKDQTGRHFFETRKTTSKRRSCSIAQMDKSMASARCSGTREITVINAVGITRLEDLSALGEFGKLAGQSQNKSAPNVPPGTAAPKPEGQKNDDN
jgi:hypothetical protein